ncbi:unnamed protein product, partial [Mesorhabditis spiculigera]
MLSYYNANRFHYFVFITWQTSIFLGTQMLFTIFAGYTPKWRCNDNEEFTTNCVSYAKCGGNVTFEPAPFGSIVMEFEKYCDGEEVSTYKRYYSQAIFFGVFFGTIAWGWLADIFGRKPIAITVFTGIIVLNICTAYLQSAHSILGVRAIFGFTLGGSLTAVWSYCNELLLPHQRIMLRAFFNWGSGRMILTLICFLLPTWRAASIAVSLAAIPGLLVIIFVLPESPIWLHNKGMLSLLASKDMLQKLLVLWFVWWVSATCAYANDLQSNSLSGNLYLNQMVFGFIIYISKWVMAWADRTYPLFSRRLLHQSSQMSTCIVFLAMSICVLTENKGLFLTALNIIGCVLIEFTWDANQMCAVESFPTVCRASAVGSCSLVARIGALMAPQLAFYGSIWPPAVYVTVFVLGLINFFVAYFGMAETKNINLEALDQAAGNRPVDDLLRRESSDL